MNSANSEEKKNSGKKRALRLAWILYLVILIAALIASFAWFINNRQVALSTKDDEIQVSVGSNIEFSLDGQHWYYEQDIPNDVEVSYMDITSDGETFYWPSTLTADDDPVMSAANFQDVTDSAGNYYIKRRIYFRTADVLDLYLDSKTKVYHAEQAKNDNNYSDNTISGLISRAPDAKYNDPSAYGDFSADGIMAATRFAFSAVDADIVLDENGNLDPADYAGSEAALKCIYIPYDSYELRYNEAGTSATYLLNGISEVSTDHGYGYIEITDEGTAQYHKYEPMDYAEGRVIVDLAGGIKNLADNSDSLINQSASIIRFLGDNGRMQAAAIDVYIWCEGTDREADEALQGGRFTYNLSFTGINKNEIAPADDKEITYAGGTLVFANGDGAAGRVIYSLDGCKWQILGTNSNPNFTPGSTVYARVKETAMTKAGSVQTITIPGETPAPEESGGGN